MLRRMIPSTQTLITVADAFLKATPGLRETALSHRIFGDTKTIGKLRGGGEITVGRFNMAMVWFRTRWPDGAALPDPLSLYQPAHEENI